MNISDLGKKYKLDGKVDVWKCHDNWILTHDAITKIALLENIKISKIESIYQSEIVKTIIMLQWLKKEVLIGVY